MARINWDEKTPSDVGYGMGYRGPKDLWAQIRILSREFGIATLPKEDFVVRTTRQRIPTEAEGWFAIPKIQTLSVKLKVRPADEKTEYLQVLGMVLAKLGSLRAFEDYERNIPATGFRRQTKTLSALDLLTKQQPGPFLLFPAQFGKFYRGVSPRLTYAELGERQFGLSAFAVACMLITHPERLGCEGDLGIICPQDEVLERDTHITFEERQWKTLYFFSEGRKDSILGIHSMRLNFVDPRFGSATGFLL